MASKDCSAKGATSTVSNMNDVVPANGPTQVGEADRVMDEIADALAFVTSEAAPMRQ